MALAVELMGDDGEPPPRAQGMHEEPCDGRFVRAHVTARGTYCHAGFLLSVRARRRVRRRKPSNSSTVGHHVTRRLSVDLAVRARPNEAPRNGRCSPNSFTLPLICEKVKARAWFETKQSRRALHVSSLAGELARRRR